jgi:hypothetical protein
MRTTAGPAAALLLLALTGCSTSQGARQAPLAPNPDATTENVVREGDGFEQLSVLTLEVRVEQEVRPYDLPHDQDSDASRAVPTGYSIFDRKGRQVARVPDHSPLGISDEGLSDVSLPPGRYLVRLDRPDGRVRTFWVTIEGQRRPEVDPAWLDPNPPAR